MARIALCIEQRICEAIILKLRSYRREKRGLPRQLERQDFVLVQRGCDQLGETDGAEQACRDASGKSRAEAGQHRQSGPERIACGRVCIIRQRIQEQVRQTMACEVSRIAYLGGKDKPSSGYSTLHGFPPQVYPSQRRSPR